MNGAAMSCQQEKARHPPQHNDSSSLHCPGYLLQTNYPCQDQSSQHQYSKALNNQLLSDNFSVDDGSSKYSQQIDNSDGRNRFNSSDCILDNRINRSSVVREPMDLPVPKFEVDEHSVGVFKYKKEKPTSVQDSKDLDLDTRIDLLIKSKALSGMHPIFSDLTDSNDSSNDSDDSYDDLSKCNMSKHDSPEQLGTHQESFDDPEKPLSRPPSPFLSRATYLFWFNKAIELKQQAKAQEKALLEKATKQLCTSSLSNVKANKSVNSKHGSSIFLNSLLSEVSKEIKDIIKQEFIKETIENTIFNSLEDWWVKETKLEEDKSSCVSSTTDDSFQFKNKDKNNEPLKSDISPSVKSNPSKIKCVSSKQKTEKPHDKLDNLDNRVTSFTDLVDTTLNEDLDLKMTTGFEAKLVSSSCNEDANVGIKSLEIDNSLKKSSFLSFEESQTNPQINLDDKTDDNSTNYSCEGKSNENLEEDIVKSVITAERDQHQLSTVEENNSIIEVANETTFLDRVQSEIADNTAIDIKQSTVLEENSLSFKDSVSSQESKFEVGVINRINNEENFPQPNASDK